MIRIWFTLSTLPVQALSASLTSPPTTSPPSLHTVSAYLQLLTETLPSPVSGYLSVLFPLPGSLFLLLFVGLSPSHSEKAMATHSSTLAWKIPWPEEPGRLQSMESRRAGHNWETSLSLFTFMHWRRKWQPTPVFLPGESQGFGAWWAAVYVVTQSRTRLKQLSSSSSSSFSLLMLKDHFLREAFYDHSSYVSTNSPCSFCRTFNYID